MHSPIATTDTLPPSPAEIRQRLEELRTRGPRLRARDAAREIGIAEARLVAAYVGRHVVRLEPRCEEILLEAPALGRVMALTRNDFCVHERKGRYENLSFEGHAGLALGQDIDLRLFPDRWHSAFAVSEQRPGGAAHSLQFFDAFGDAVHKIHLLPESDRTAFDRLRDRFADAGQSDTLALRETEAPQPAPVDPAPDSAAAAALRADWDRLRDTHEFFPLLKRHGLARLSALRIAGPERAQRLDAEAHRRVLRAAAKEALPIMVFVGNPGCIQIHSGTVSTLRQVDDWFNVLDPDFNLHLLESGIAQSWLVRKPTDDGIVTSVELFDREGRQIVSLFGVRKPGQPENPAWKRIAERLVRQPAP